MELALYNHNTRTNLQFSASLPRCVASGPTRCSVTPLSATLGDRSALSLSSAEPGGESTSCIRSRRPSRRPPNKQPVECVVASFRRRQPASDIDRQPSQTAGPTAGSAELVWVLRRGTRLLSDCGKEVADTRRMTSLEVTDVGVSATAVSPPPRCSSASRRLYDPEHSS